ncbi:MAG TPA: response regulator [Steroidobacteraceae bacterium]|nr:response regulator [Steroidobacteraceae bacterium]
MPNVSASAPLNVVIIDDNRDAADTLALLFEVVGHTAHVAYDPRTGIKLVQEVQPDLAFFDLDMPDLDGCQALAELKKLAPDVRALFVCLTGQCSPEAKLRCQEAGFEHFITKPLSNVDFESIIELAQRRRALG